MRMGNPITPKIAFKGSDIGSVKELIASEKREMIAPRIMTPGNSILWSPVWKIFRARCGTRTPKKAIGPQNEVTNPERIAVNRMSKNFIFFIESPELLA